MSSLNTDEISQLKELATEVAGREGVQLYDLEFVGRGSGRILRIFIDRAEGGVSIDDCANVSRGLNILLDAEDIIPGGAYELEVSSPGLERHLSETWHYEAALGKSVRVRTNAPIPLPESEDKGKPSKLKSLEGELVSASDQQLVVKKNEIDWVIPRSIVHKANIRFIDAIPSMPKKKSKNKKKKR